MRTLYASALLASISLFTGCKAIDAMDNTEAMKTDLASMKATTGGMADTTEQMKDTMGELKTAASLGEGIELIGKPENLVEFSPPSVGLLVGAKTIGKYATPEEFMSIFAIQLSQFKDASFPERWNTTSATDVNEFNKRLNVRVFVGKALAGLLPQEKLKVILQEQLSGGGGAYSDETYTLLMLRARFLNDYLIDKTAFGSKVNNLGKLRRAHEYIGYLQFIADLPYADKIVFDTDKFMATPRERTDCSPEEMELEECNPRDNNIHDSLVDKDLNKVTLVKPWWEKLPKVIKRDIPAELKSENSPYFQEIEKIREEAQNYASQG